MIQITPQMRILVAVEPAGTLQNKIHRSHIGEHQVKVQIEALLNDLRSHNDGLIGAALVRLFTEIVQNAVLGLVAPSKGKASMKENQI